MSIFALLVSLGCNAAPAATPQAVPQAPAPAPLAPVARIETADLWQDLIAQRPSAVTLAGDRLVVDLGRPHARPLLELGPGSSPWRLAHEHEGRRVGLLHAAGGSLVIPLDGDLAPARHPDVDGQPALAVAITLRATRPGQAATVLWNEQPLAHLQVGESWERRTLSLPAASTHAGDSRLRLHFAKPAPAGQPTAMISRIEFGPRAAIVGEPTDDVDRPPYVVSAVEGGGLTLDMAPGTGLAYYLVAPRRGRLRLDVRGRGGLRVRVSTDADHREGRAPSELLAEPLRPTGAQHDLDLAGYGGEPIRVEVAVHGEDSAASVRALEVVVRRSRPVDHRERKIRDLYVLAVEGARPDDLLGVLLRGPRFEHVEALSQAALVFDRAYAPGPWAVPSHAALLSSLAPPVHATVKGIHVADAQIMLPELLDRAGYHNVLVAANPDVNGDRGLTQGFDASYGLSRGTAQGNDGRAVVAAALANRGPRAPRFVYADLIDPQAPYDPPRELLGELSAPEGAPLPHLSHMWLGRVRTGAVVPDAAQREYIRRLYRGELQVVDGAVGDLMRSLAQSGELDQAIVVLVGVHGEEFLEHGGTGHGHTLHDESLRVPLAIHAPALLAPGRVSAPVDLLDLAPTLADLLGLPIPPEWQGTSLVPVIDDPQPPPRLVVSYLGDGSRAAIVGDLKLILGSGRDSQRFYDLSLDPGETTSRTEGGGIGLRVVRTALAWEMMTPGVARPGEPAQRWKRARWGTGADLLPAFARDHGM